MNSDEVSKWVKENNEPDASSLLDEKFPTIKSRLKRASNSLVKILNEIRQEFPEAEYYTASGGFHLMLCFSHGNSTDIINSEPHQERMAWGSINLTIGDGDF